MKVLAGICVLVALVVMAVFLSDIPGSQAQAVVPSNFSAFSQIPRSSQRPSQNGVIGVSIVTVGLVVFSCTFVFMLGLYEEMCLMGTSSSGKPVLKRSATIGSRYGGSRYRPPQTRLAGAK